MPGLLDFVVAPLEVEAQHRNAPFVHYVGIDLAVAVLIRDHLAASGEVNVGAVNLAQVALQFHTVTAAQNALGAAEHAGPRHAAPAPDFDVISA